MRNSKLILCSKVFTVSLLLTLYFIRHSRSRSPFVCVMWERYTWRLRTGLGSGLTFYPWVLRIELSLSSSVASAFTHRAFSPTQVRIFLISLWCLNSPSDVLVCSLSLKNMMLGNRESLGKDIAESSYFTLILTLNLVSESFQIYNQLNHQQSTL